MKEINPPAIVRSVSENEHEKSLIAQLRTLYRRRVTDRIACGELLHELRLVWAGEFEKRATSVFKLSARTLYRDIKAFEIRDEFARSEDPDSIEESKTSQGVASAIVTEASTSQGAVIPPAEQQFCSRDCRVGKGPKDCKKCAKLNATPPESSAFYPPFMEKPVPAPAQPENARPAASVGGEQAAGGKAGAGRREPGDGSAEPEHKLLNWPLKTIESIKKRLATQAKSRIVPAASLGAANATAATFTRQVTEILRAPVKPPVAKQCFHCKKPCRLVTRHSDGKRLLVEAGGGQYELVDGGLAEARATFDPDSDHNTETWSNHICREAIAARKAKQR